MCVRVGGGVCAVHRALLSWISIHTSISLGESCCCCEAVAVLAPIKWSVVLPHLVRWGELQGPSTDHS
jgi:hypothetical protein